MDRAAWTGPRLALLGVVLAYLALFLLVPLVAIAVQVITAGLGTIASALLGRDALDGLGRTLLITIIVVLLNAVFGVAAALVLARHRFPGQWLLDALVDLPIAISPVMIGLAFMLVVGREGWFAPLLDRLGLQVMFSFPGLVLGTLFVTLPFTTREVSHVLKELGAAEEEAAFTLGASRWQTFRLVTLPNIRHGLTFGVTLTAARSLGEFGAVLVLGGAIAGRTQTATTYIYAAIEERQEAGAYGMSLVLAALSIALLVLLDRLKRRMKKGA